MPDFLSTYGGDTPLDGKYKILERLGSGGMGEVYKAEHVYLGAIRVIKVIRQQIAGSSDAHDRFLREARAATRVQHPNVAVLHDFSALPDGSHYMVWEYIDGENLAQVLRRRGTLPPREAVRLAIQALHGLEAIHRAGIVHRDIGPENLMITRDTQTVKIIDLGVAKLEDSDVAVTRTGIFVGKLRYAAPEQLGFLPENERIDGRADLYSLGMVLYEMLTGRPPFEGKSPHEYLRIHSEETALQMVDLSRDLSGDPGMQAVLRKALSRDRKKRFQSAAEFAAALEKLDVGDSAYRETVREPLPTVITPLPVQQRPRSSQGWIIGLAVAVVVIAVIAFVALRPRHEGPAETATIAMTETKPAPAPQPAQTDVSVVAPTTSVPTTSSGAPAPSPAQSTPHTTKPKPVEPLPAPAHTETQVPVPPPPPPTPEPAPAVYVEGGDRDTNSSLLSHLRSQLRGVTTIALQAGAMQDDLAKALKHEVRNLTIADSADVTIRFDGTLEHLGRGKKRRAAQASVIKNGRVIFRYEMPSEEYRVGDTPVEAFTGVIGEALKD